MNETLQALQKGGYGIVVIFVFKFNVRIRLNVRVRLNVGVKQQVIIKVFVQIGFICFAF